MINDSSEKSGKQSKPDYLRRLGGVALTIIGGIGLIVTSPLSLAGGSIGLLTGAITGTNLLELGYLGVKFGSLGSLDAILFGIDLATATVRIEEDTQHKLPLLKEKPAETTVDFNQEPVVQLKDPDTKDTSQTIRPTPATFPDTFFPKTESKPKLDAFKTTESYNFDIPAEIESFLIKVQEFIARDEAHAELNIEDNSSNVQEQYIARLTTVITTPAVSPHEFWDRLEQMSNKDIKSFVSQLSSMKEAGKNSSSQLDYLWRQCNSVEFEPSKMEHKKTKFAVMLKALSEEQLKASFASPDFLSVLNKDSYVDAAANSLNHNQLGLFASNIQMHEVLDLMIRKLKPDPYLLGKLISIMPYATGKVRVSLINQLAHLPHPASFKIELTKLAEHYIGINMQAYKPHRDETRPSMPTPHKPLPSKWASVHTPKPVYNNSSVEKEDWSDEDFESFLHDLNATTYIINEKKIIEDLTSLPDHRIKLMINRAASPEFKDLLKHLWLIESKTINHKSFIDSRENRLKIILEHLSESQLKISIEDNKFWDIFKNTQEPYCQMAANVLTPSQFTLIASNAAIEKHASFAMIISKIKKDSLTDKERCQKILEAIIPHTTPWIVLALELQIKTLLVHDKQLLERFHADLRKFLSESMERPDVNVHYKRDLTLNKRAISLLLVEHSEITQSHSLTLNV